MQIRWLKGDTEGKVEYLDYHSVQQALMSDPDLLEIVYGLDQLGNPVDQAEQGERRRSPVAALDMGENPASVAPGGATMGRGAEAGDAGRVGPSSLHKSTVFDPGDAVNAGPPMLAATAVKPEQSPREASLEGGRRIVEETNRRVDELAAQQQASGAGADANQDSHKDRQAERAEARRTRSEGERKTKGERTKGK